jgi:hypothetical protein
MSGGGHGHGGGLPFLDKVEGFIHGSHGQGIAYPIGPFLYGFPVLTLLFFFLAPLQTLKNLELTFFLAPLWMPIVLVPFAIYRFVHANRAGFFAKQQHVLLELRMPRDVRKSPLAMETFFNNMQIAPGESTWWKKFVQGQTRPWWSFEIASLGGRVHFYVWTREGFRRGVESFLYAQYPGLEIIEATDYSRSIDPNHAPWQMWGCDYEKKKPDPWPIKSYAAFMRPDAPLAKPEEQVDPLSQVIEYLGSMGPKEQFWIQIMIRVHKGEKYARKNAAGKPYTWIDEGLEIIDGIRKSTVKKSKFTDPATGKVIETEGFPNPTKGQLEGIAAIENNIYKPAFDVGMRAIYAAQQGSFQGSVVSHLISLMKPFDGANTLGIARYGAIFTDLPWEDVSGHHKSHLFHQLVDAYRRRSYFHEPYKTPPFTMSGEELATLFHVPSAGVAAPSLPRISSSTSEAPSNLPT